MLKEKLKQSINRLIPKKENIRPLFVSIAGALFFFLGFYFLGNYFTEIMWIVVLALLGILLSIIMWIAGFAVLKSLATVGAELSLLIFLAQSYCGVPNRLTQNDAALKSLIIFSIIFIIFAFGRSLYTTLKDDYKTIRKERWSKEKIGVVTLFLIFTGLLIWEIYLVVSPIIYNLCIYK